MPPSGQIRSRYIQYRQMKWSIRSIKHLRIDKALFAARITKNAGGVLKLPVFILRRHGLADDVGRARTGEEVMVFVGIW